MNEISSVYTVGIQQCHKLVPWKKSTWQMETYAGSLLVRGCFQDNVCKEGETAVGLEREKLNCHAATTKVPASPSGNSGAGMAFSELSRN